MTIDECAACASERFTARYLTESWETPRFAAEVSGYADQCKNFWYVDLPDAESVRDFQAKGRAAILENAPHRTIRHVRLWDRAAREYRA